MKYQSAFKALTLCQLHDNHSFQGYSQLTFSSLVGLPHSASHCSLSHVGLPHCEKCGSATFRISLSGGSATLLQQLTGLFVAYISLTCGSATFLTLQPQLSELLESYQQWELTFLSTVAYRATKILITLRVDNPVAFRATRNLEDTMLPINYWS